MAIIVSLGRVRSTAICSTVFELGSWNFTLDTILSVPRRNFFVLRSIVENDLKTGYFSRCTFPNGFIHMMSRLKLSQWPQKCVDTANIPICHSLWILERITFQSTSNLSSPHNLLQWSLFSRPLPKIFYTFASIMAGSKGYFRCMLIIQFMK